jgi:hypothetical protein
MKNNLNYNRNHNTTSKQRTKLLGWAYTGLEHAWTSHLQNRLGPKDQD